MKRVYLAVGLAVMILAAACGGSTPTAPSPSPTPAPTPAPSPTPAPAPAPAPAPTPAPTPTPAPAPVAALESVSMSPASVEGGQANTTGTVRLTAQAPGGDANVALTSDNIAVATVPASVTIASGSTANTFPVTTLAVSDSKTVTITATYLGVTKTGTFIVTATANRAAFAVKDGTRGSDTCTITSSAGTLDCKFDGSDSKGSVAKYYWTTTVGPSVTEFNTTEASSTPQTICDSFKGGTPVTVDSRPQYLTMTVKLQVADSSDKKSDPATRTVRLYPSSECGYGF